MRSFRTLFLSILIAVSYLPSATAFWPFDGAKAEPKPAAAPAQSQALTLAEAYKLALARSEDIAISQSAIDEAQGHFYQAFDVIMPSVHFEMSRMYQDAPERSSVSSDGISSSATRPNTPMKRFTFSQPLFSGFKEFAALQGAGAEKAQRRFERKRAEHLLFIDVMEAYYAYLQSGRDVLVLEETKKALGARVQELDQRVKIGRSRDTEIEEARAEEKVVEADLLEAQRLREVSKELLEFYIGKAVNEEPVEDEIPDKEDPSLSYFLSKANDRPDVKASENAQTLAEKNVVAAQAGLFPTAKVEGNYYTQRVGFQSGNDWDTTVTVDVPIFEGTQVIGDIKVAHAGREKADAELSKARRSAVLDIQNAHQSYLYSAKRAAALADAAAALKRNAEIQAEDYKLNLVNNLDVLDSLRRSQDISRTANAAHFEAKRNYWKLKVAGGETV